MQLENISPVTVMPAAGHACARTKTLCLSQCFTVAFRSINLPLAIKVMLELLCLTCETSADAGKDKRLLAAQRQVTHASVLWQYHLITHNSSWCTLGVCNSKATKQVLCTLASGSPEACVGSL